MPGQFDRRPACYLLAWFNSNFLFYLIHGDKNFFVMLSAIWYHLYNLKNVKNTHRGVLQAYSMGVFKVF